MPALETLERFIKRVEENAHAEAVEEFYTENTSLRENQDAPKFGRAFHAAKERNFLSRVKSVQSQCIYPVFVNGNYVVIRWKFRFVLPDETVIQIEELAYQRWENELIAEEEFFFDPAQKIPKKP